MNQVSRHYKEDRWCKKQTVQDNMYMVDYATAQITIVYSND